jgi:LAO/AO transport system kinase
MSAGLAFARCPTNVVAPVDGSTRRSMGTGVAVRPSGPATTSWASGYASTIRAISSGSVSAKADGRYIPKTLAIRRDPPTAFNLDPVDVTAQIVGGDRRALARAITLVESTRDDHRAEALALLESLPHHGSAFRIGITGTPGVGKSTFIEAFGLHLVGLGLRVAVLAVDPSSSRTGGSILGDKTRMAELARHPNAFIRPTAAGGTLGGVARRTREVIRLVEGAGYDVVIVETVGVGQSETAVANLTDAFVLLVAPAGGDELQGVKRGIMELADIVVVNKCDGGLEAQARSTLSDYASALRLMRPTSTLWTPHAIAASALTGLGVAEVWMTLQELRTARAPEEAQRRAEQDRSWLWTELTERLTDHLRADERVRAVEADVLTGRLTTSRGVDAILSIAVQ